MLKLVKYEYRRNLTGIVVMLTGIVGLQAYFLLAAMMKNYDNVLISASLLAAASSIAIAGVLLYSISLYSRELNAKTSYLTFMTPHSSAKILGAKLLATLILGCTFALLLCLFAVWDFGVLRQIFPELNLAELMLDRVLAELNASVSSLMMTLASLALEFLVAFFSTVVIAYLAITLSATVLQNKRFKGIVSFILFVAIMVGINFLTNLMPIRYDYASFSDMMTGIVPIALIHLAAMLVAFFSSVWLLDKKVSL